jgi:ribose transport system ATP-binding protein
MARENVVPVLTIEHLSKTFSGNRVLDDVGLEVLPGEVHALVGQNGSGKSTLIKVLAGFHSPDPGSTVRIPGASIRYSHPSDALSAGLRFVHQDLALIESLNTVDNLGLVNGFTTGVAGRIRWKKDAADAERRLRALGYSFDVRRLISELAAAERTGVAIARALQGWQDAKVLILDEPTAALPSDETAILFEAIDRVRRAGLGVIYVSHRLDEVFSVADRVTVLRDGRHVATVRTDEIDQDGLVSLMVGGVDLEARREVGNKKAEQVVLDCADLGGDLVAGISFSAHAGEVLGISGLTGSGRDEVLSLLFGAKPRSGSVSIGGNVVSPGRPEAAIRAGMALVAADRHKQSSIVSLKVRENCTLTDLRVFSAIGGWLRLRAERKEVRKWINNLDVRPPSTEAVFATLSGGNQQKIVLAKWLRLAPKVLLLDEPTQGVDVHAKGAIHKLVREAAGAGASVVVASSDEAELCDVCDRIIVMHEGAIVSEILGDRMTRAELARLQHAGAFM